MSRTASRTPQKTPDRSRIVEKLRRTCELAQGLCLTGLVVAVFLLCALIYSDVRNFPAVRTAYPDDGAAAFGCWTYVHGAQPDDPIVVYGSTSSMLLTGEVARDYRDGETLDDSEMESLSRRLRETESRASSVGPAADRLYTPREGQLPVVFLVQSYTTHICAIALFYLGSRFFNRIKESGDPFMPERARELLVIAIAFLAASVFPGLLGAAAVALGAAVQPGFDVSLASYRLVLVNNALFFAGILTFAFSRLWRLGCLLQEQDDGLV